MKGDGAFTKLLLEVWQVVCETYAALTADITLVIAAVEFLLHLVGKYLDRIKK